MSPFQIRREPFKEFCLLIKRLQNQNKEVKAMPKGKNGKQKNYIPVLDYKEPSKKGGGVNG
jgi:hypothetical protein